MRLTRRFTIWITFAIVIVLGVNAGIHMYREHDLFEASIRAESALLADAVVGAAERTWRLNGEAEALDLVDDVNDRDATAHIRWVWLDDTRDAERRPIIAGLPRALDRPYVVRAHDPSFDEDAVFTYVPLSGPRPAALEVSKSLGEERRYARRTLIQVLISSTLLLVVCAGVAHVLGKKLIGAPVDRLVAHARAIGQGQLDKRLAVTPDDEIGALGVEMNLMSERLAHARAKLAEETGARLSAVEQLRHADRLASVGKLAAGIAHEVGTPLNVITGTAQLITADHRPETPTHQNAVVIAEQARRVASTIRQLLDFARPRRASRATHELGKLVADSCRLLETFAHKHGVSLETDVRDRIEVSVDAAQLHQVITNLIANAVHASKQGRAVAIRVEAAHVAPPAEAPQEPLAHAKLIVEDHGHGITADNLPRIFEPFFTTKDVGEGTGLGLAVVYGIVKEHGGWIDVRSEVDLGTTFTVYLPVSAS